MDLPLPAPGDPAEHARRDRSRLRLGFAGAALALALLWWIRAFEWLFEVGLGGFGVRPGLPEGLLGVLFGPLLHGSTAHLLANTLPLAILLALSIATVPRALARALPLIWIGSGLFVWFTGSSGSTHLGASGLTHGLMFFLFLLGLLRRDRPAIATALIVFFLYGGMLMTVFPREAGISWQYHLGGALFGSVAAVRWRRLDPAPPRKRYSWEDEPAEAAGDDQFELPRPDDVPVLWQREHDDRAGPANENVVVPFKRRDR